MKVTIAANGAINIDADVRKITGAQADDVMKQVSELIGDRLGAVKLSGYWVVGRFTDTGKGWEPLYGGHEQPRGRRFDVALGAATQRTVVTLIPTK